MFWQFEIRFWHFNPASVFIAADLRSVGEREGAMVLQRGRGGGAPREGAAATQRVVDCAWGAAGVCGPAVCRPAANWKHMAMSPPSGK